MYSDVCTLIYRSCKLEQINALSRVNKLWYHAYLKYKSEIKFEMLDLREVRKTGLPLTKMVPLESSLELRKYRVIRKMVSIRGLFHLRAGAHVGNYYRRKGYLLPCIVIPDTEVKLAKGNIVMILYYPYHHKLIVKNLYYDPSYAEGFTDIRISQGYVPGKVPKFKGNLHLFLDARMERLYK